MMSSAPDPTSIPGLVARQFGVEVSGDHARFREPGWSFQGSTSIECPNCDGLEAYISYRKPYTTTQGDYRYWGLVCLSCQTISALGDLSKELKRRARSWDAQVAASELELDNEDLNAEADNDNGLDAAAMQVEPEPVEAAPPTVAAHATRATPASAHVVDDSLKIVADAAKAELDASKSATRTVDVGPATPVSDDQLVFQIDQPAIDLGEQAHGELFLAVAPASSARHQVADVRVADRKLVVLTVAEAIPDPTDLRLYCEINPTIVAQAFADYLGRLTSAGQASVMLGDTALAARSSAFVDGLNPEQQAGVGAIISPGVCAIWGPPGTGKTRVIGEAVAELVRLGQSVAVVSNTNVAVDQALLHVARVTTESTPGTVIRIGHPSIPEVADHPSLTVRKVIELTQVDLIRELNACRRELTALRSELEHITHDTDGSKATVGDLTPDDVRQILKRQTQRARLPTATKELEKTQATQRTLQKARKTAASTRTHANDAWTTSAPFHDLEDVEQGLAAHDQEIAELETRNSRLQDRAAAATTMSIFKRRRALKGIENERSELEQHLTEARAIRSGLQSRLEAAARELMTPDRIRQLRNEREVASSDLETATKALKAAADKAKRHRKTVEELEAVPPLGPTEDAVVELVGRSGSVEKVFEQLSAHDALVQELRTQIAAAESRVVELQQRLSDLEKSIVRDARVVGTTLAQLVLHKGLIERPFDHVIVDEASAALAPYAFAALSKARLGGALVGDFEQNGPITRTTTEKLPESIKPWLTDHPFAHVGIRDAATAQQHAGCAVLRKQYRFGSLTMRLANDVAYAGLLDFGRAAHTRAPDDPEIVFIDVSDLGEAGTSHRVPKAPGRWSPAGAAIVREIVERDGTDGIGIVTPYRAQASLIGARLADGHLRGIQVGTAHRFQGREFPTVILDMVQNPGGNDWIARARRDGNDWQRTGVRIFNVGITRNADRLYIIGNQRVVRSSTRGPLRHLRKLIAEDEVPVWSASELLGGVAIPNAPTEPPFPHRDVDQAMALYGDDDFYDQLRIDLGQARELIVIFSPFIAPDRLETILPQLASAVSRGVRVVALTKDPSELLSPGLLNNLVDHGIKVFTKHGRHEKVVIIDDQVSYVGSLNALSNTGKTKEVMMRFEGSSATSLITEWMRKAA